MLSAAGRVACLLPGWGKLQRNSSSLNGTGSCGPDVRGILTCFAVVLFPSLTRRPPIQSPLFPRSTPLPCSPSLFHPPYPQSYLPCFLVRPTLLMAWTPSTAVGYGAGGFWPAPPVRAPDCSFGHLRLQRATMQVASGLLRLWRPDTNCGSR